MRYSIITPVYNKMDITGKFIKNLSRYLTPDGELVIVDNASQDNTQVTINLLKVQYPRMNLTYYRSEKNLGFGTANNIGVKLAQSDNLFFFNNDVELLASPFETVLAYFQKHERIAVGPRLVNFPTGWNDIWNEIALIPYLEGWCFAIKKQWFEMVGGFDEHFFLDYEDIDLCMRLHLAGISMAQLTLPVFHPISGNSFRQLPEGRAFHTKNSIEYFQKKWNFTLKKSLDELFQFNRN